MFDRHCEIYWERADYLPVEAVISYWCNNNCHCQEAKTHALLGALERGEVKFRRADGKNFIDPIHQLHHRGLILVERESFITWAKGISSEAELRNLQRDMAISPRSETTYLNILGSLLNLITTTSPGGQKYSIFESQSAIIESILANFPNTPGLSKRTLEDKFGAANKAFKENVNRPQ